MQRDTELRSAGYMALHRAAQKGHMGTVTTLLQGGADVNAENKQAVTALHVAARHGHADVVAKLLRHGAAVNSRTWNDQTALRLAAERGHAPVVAKLLARGADVNARTINGWSALHFAACHGHAQVVEALLARGARVRSRSNDGNTALHRAARRNDEKVAEMLWNAGADPLTKNHRGETALSLLQPGSELKQRIRSSLRLSPEATDNEQAVLPQTTAASPPSSRPPKKPSLKAPASPSSKTPAAQSSKAPAAQSSKPLAAPSSKPLAERSSTRSAAWPTEQHVPYHIFLSHAGEDKETIARPLHRRLSEHGLTVFLDVQSFRLGDHSPDVMQHAMNTAPVGVFIMSPEFVAKRWTMLELLAFVRRFDRARASGRSPPLLIPVFYRLSTRECRDARIFETYGKLCEKHGLFRRAMDGSMPLHDVSLGLHTAATVWGIENEVGASNLQGPNMASTREFFIQTVLQRILERLGKDTSPP